MKLRWFDRLLLVLVSLFVMVESAMIAGLALGRGRAEFDYWVNLMLTWNINRVIVFVVCVILFVIAIRLLFLRAKRASTPNTVFMRTSEAGTISITLAAIEAIVSRVARGNAQIRDVKVRIVPADQQMSVYLRIMLSPDSIVKEISSALQELVKSTLEDSTGIPVTQVQVVIEALPATTTHQRVE